jgi:hypothetical protein
LIACAVEFDAVASGGGDDLRLAGFGLHALHRFGAVEGAVAVLTAGLAGLLGLATLRGGALALLGGLGHGVEDAEVMLSVLKVTLGHHAVAAAGRVAAELEVFLEQLLRGAADAHVWAGAVEHVVAVERDAATLLADRLAATAAASTAATWPMIASAHTFHVHEWAIALSCSLIFTWLRAPR